MQAVLIASHAVLGLYLAHNFMDSYNSLANKCIVIFWILSVVVWLHAQ